MDQNMVTASDQETKAMENCSGGKEKQEKLKKTEKR